jgi:hypothetical protein
MAKIKLCKVCGVPRRFIKEHAWLDNGTIVQRENPDHRMIFIENQNIQSTFQGVEEIIGMPIERIITEAKRRATFDFVDHMLPGIVKAIVKRVGVRPVVKNVTGLGMVMGFGNVRLDHIRRVHGKGDYVVIRCKELYSVPLFGGDILGTFNAVDGRETGVTSEQIGPEEHLITAHMTPNPIELQERLQTKEYTRKPGDIKFDPCPKCGGPMALARYKWHTDRGVIISQTSGHRMIAIGPASLDAVVVELEKELGDTIPRVVVEAQRRVVRGGFYPIEEARSQEALREALALRGMGNLREITWREGGLHFHIENPCLIPVLVGLVQGIFEMVTGRDSEVNWEVTADGDLTVDVATTA